MRMLMVGWLLVVSMAGAGRAQSGEPVRYTLRVDAADLSGFSVAMRIANAPGTFRLAMAAHPEYDDRFWRYVDGPRVESAAGAATVVREDSAVWRVTGVRGEAVVRYGIKLPGATPGERAAWRPFLVPTGGLVGGPHSFMYVEGWERMASRVTLDLPVGWSVSTALAATSDPRVFRAGNVDTLLDSPVLAGNLRAWRFTVAGVLHRVAYWPLPAATPFDTTTFVSDIERFSREAIKLFGRAPYRDFTFQYHDGAFGGLEHAGSVTLGALSANLARNPHAYLNETAHEFFHTWNLMRIHPAGYGAVTWRPPVMSRGLWFSEGLTMFYADLLTRRAGLPPPDSTRVAHLEYLIGRYLSNPANEHVSAERGSEAAYALTPGGLGDYDVSTHLQGEVIGAMLDFVVRDASSGRKSMDDVMRVMLKRFSGERGFTGRDVEAVVAGVCGCAVTALFDAHVRGASAIDFDRYLRLVGMRARVTWASALGRDGKPAPDTRVRAWDPPGERAPSLLIGNPTTVWGRAGLHTGDRLTSVNGAAVPTVSDFRMFLGRVRVGDTVHVDIVRGGAATKVDVVITGYDRPVVRLEELPVATARQRAIRERWMAGQP